MIETAFTPWTSLSGGILIGLAAVLLMLCAGRIMGATGILAGLLSAPSGSEFAWRAAVLMGMISGPVVLWLVSGENTDLQSPAGTPALVVGGLLVGIGVTFGGGCTSGHGVCGMARLSLRSVAATATFMLFAFATVFITRHVI